MAWVSRHPVSHSRVLISHVAGPRQPGMVGDPQRRCHFSVFIRYSKNASPVWCDIGIPTVECRSHPPETEYTLFQLAPHRQPETIPVENPRKAVRLRRQVWLNRCVVAIFPGAATATVVKMPVIPRRLSTREKDGGAATEDVVGVTGLPCLRLRRQSRIRRTHGSRK